jgi:EmrB/QacA subfamily drug resistance transporter
MFGYRSILQESARPAVIRENARAPWLAVGVVCFGAFMGQLDASIVTITFPAMERDFGVQVAAVQWVSLIYLLGLVALLALAGRLGDAVGRKLVYTYGFVVFTLASLACGLAPSLGVLIGLRLVQAAGAAMLQANSVAILYLALPRRSLGRGIGIQGAAQALGLALGPSIGGFLLALAGWRLIFFVNVPVGLVGTAAAWVFLPRSRHLRARTRFDWRGLALFVPAVVGLLLAVSFGDVWGWGSPPTLALLGLSVLSGCGFALWERRVDNPMVELSLFRRVSFAAGIASGMCSFVVLFGVMFAVPFFLEAVHHMGASRAGLVLTALPLALAVVAPLSGKLADRVGARPLTVAGMAVVAGSLVLLAGFHASTGVLLVELVLIGVGLGLFTPANNAAVMSSAPPDRSGLASGVLNMSRGIGTALGLALASLVFGRAADHGATAAQTGAALARAALLFAVVAVAAAVLAAARGRVGRAEKARFEL